MANLSWQQIRINAIQFQKEWENETSEHAEAKSFWDQFFAIFGLDRRRVAVFEKRVKRHDGIGFIDLLWKNVLLVEHKSKGKNLESAYQQATDYFPGLTESELPQYILVSDFENFVLYDLDNGGKRSFPLNRLHEHIELFGFIAGYQQQVIKEQDPVNIEAAYKMGKLHDKLKEIGYTGHDLEVYLVRLLFCMFADDTGIFEKNLFKDYIEQETKMDGSDLAGHLEQIFETLNTPEDNRLTNLSGLMDLLPYVNGNLFAERLKVASFDSEMRKILLDSSKLNWGLISPAIFGSLFQSVMNPLERRELGAHYTSEENIMKVIKSLFLDDLYEELAEIKKRKNQRQLYFDQFHQKLSELTFFDPACGCGNFLIIAYRELRILELEVIRQLLGNKMLISIDIYAKVNVDQFYGIEIEEFPSQIAQVAMWLIDHQMNMALSNEFGQYFVRLPLRKTAKIVYGNSLLLDWNTVISTEECSYLLGNPPFIGFHLMNDIQKDEILEVAKNFERAGLLDYVCAWFIKAADFMKDSTIKAALVSTNSISQGSQALILWKPLFERGVNINFAHQTFKWTNEAEGKAAVYCCIVGFSYIHEKKKALFLYPRNTGEPTKVSVTTINQYLLEAPSIFIEARSKHIEPHAPKMTYGSKPADGGHLIFSDEEYYEFIQKEPLSIQYFKKYVGATELMGNKHRYILYLKHCPPHELRKMPYVLNKVEKVRAMRVASKDKNTNKWAEQPSLMQADRVVEGELLVIPSTTSEYRKIIPFGFYGNDAICSNALFQISEDTTYMFGLLNSAMHMAWTKVVCGRLKGDFRYSNTLVYHNFIFPKPTNIQKKNIQSLSERTINIREHYFSQGSTLADLYDSIAMPVDLMKAHQALDKAVDKAYRGVKFENDNERVAFLFQLYEEKTK